MLNHNRIRVLCADDHPLVRDGIAFALLQETDMELVGEAKDGQEAVESYRRLRPDVTLMDLQMPRMNGMEALVSIRNEFPQAKIVVLTTYSGDIQASRALKSGASSYLLKDMLRDNLIETIRCVHAGQTKIPAEIATGLAEHLNSDDLSPREIEVLQNAADGCSNKIIADRLGLTEQTVKGYMKSVFAKLGANDRTHAVMIAVKRGFLDT
ncbi:response regulator transcription factor [Granulicella arctica]|uniref:DNA-binding NarL/FixJ family response regulator n=1 Tax=Granulicella arctica TaxID=940613 RepID=A0A7Y9PFM2_9BACT|nr:response regulator transcription factor [Granulicella arctica]NYF79043.1 DNA-binding NarL/FixJ family response regulator [Granulicella arctica]